MYTEIINLNLQEGILLLSNSKQVIGGFNHHHHVIILQVPYNLSDIEVPKELAGYKVISGYTDSLGLRYWRPTGNKDAHEIVYEYDRDNAR